VKIKKIGGMTSFNMFIIRELDLMNVLLSDIRTTLLVNIYLRKYGTTLIFKSPLSPQAAFILHTWLTF